MLCLHSDVTECKHFRRTVQPCRTAWNLPEVTIGSPPIDPIECVTGAMGGELLAIRLTPDQCGGLRRDAMPDQDGGSDPNAHPRRQRAGAIETKRLLDRVAVERTVDLRSTRPGGYSCYVGTSLAR